MLCYSILVLFCFDAFPFVITGLAILCKPLKGLLEQSAQAGVSSDNIFDLLR